MILGSLRLGFLFLVALTVVYFAASVYSRSVRREKLEKEWDGDPDRAGLPADQRQQFIATGMIAYERGLKRRLLWLIYILPTAGFVVVFYLVNWY